MKSLTRLFFAAALFSLVACHRPVRQDVAGRTQPVHPPCVPTQALLPGSGFSPEVSGEVRVKAMKDLLTKIATCQPFPYIHDGIIFTNKENLLPQQPPGYYIEYTLEIPGSSAASSKTPVVVGTTTYLTGEIFSSRGPERLVIGNGSRIFYTPDHYVHFVELRIVR